LHVACFRAYASTRLISAAPRGSIRNLIRALLDLNLLIALLDAAYVLHGGRLVTCDRAVPLAAVPNAARADLDFVESAGASGDLELLLLKRLVRS
jgi:hypothetical protein